jgi:hypothetical protein
LLRLIMAPGQVTELRALGVSTAKFRKPHTESGYFDDPEKLAAEAAALNEYTGLYIVPNPVNPDLVSRANNRLKVPNGAPLTGDTDIIDRHWLLVDLDPVRPSGISASDLEHDAAIQKGYLIRKQLGERGWPDPILADSGNGCHLMYRIDLPVDDHGLVKRVLDGLSLFFDDGIVNVDTTTSNPAQLWKLYGSWARKGDDTESRPHRLAKIVGAPEELLCVPESQLHEIASLVPVHETTPVQKDRGSTGFDVEKWLVAHELDVSEPRPWKDGRKWVLSECVWNPSHTNGSAYIVEFGNGALAAGCHHNSCDGKGWRDLRTTVEDNENVSLNNSADSAVSAGRALSPEELHVTPEWEIPVPLRSYTLPDFPLDILPDWLADFVYAEAVTTQTPNDLAGMLSIASCATALTGRFKVQVKPDWYEPLNLYVAVALPSGDRKSRVFRDVTLPIRDFESLLRDAFGGEIAEENAKLDILEERLKQAKTNASKADDPVERTKWENEAAALAYELEFSKRLNIPRFLADDVSPEKLSNLLWEQDGRLALMSAEGTVFDLISGRYSRGIPNLDVYLNAHPGDSIRVDRIGRPSEFIENPALTIGVAVQPDVLKRLADKPELRGRGLLARFLYSLPESKVGMRDPDPPARPDFVRDRYRDNLQRLIVLGRPDGWKEPPEPYTLLMSPEARNEMIELSRRVEPRLGDFGNLEFLRDWGSKLAGEVARIAGILHLAEHVHDEDPWIMEVSPETVRRAVTLGENYLIDHAVAAHALMGADSNIEDALYILKWIKRKEITIASKRDIFDELRGRFDRADQVEPGIRILITHGYLREASKDKRAGRGRPPSPKYEVNPYVHSQNPHIAQNSNGGSVFELGELGLAEGVSLN